MPHYDLPPDLLPEEERVVLAALEHMLALERPRPAPWAVAGRAENLRLGRLQIRRHVEQAWPPRTPAAFVAGGTRPQTGRGDSR
jgi:hypothetical protein